MYPGVIIDFDDQSDISSIPITEVRNRPLFCAVFSSDKGTEAWTRVSGEDFFKMYGNNISFNKHGQPLLQAAMTINAGAELLCKRVVASDSTLANIAIVATVTDKSEEVQKRDNEGNLLYLDAAGEPTVEVTDSPLMETKKNAEISYSATYLDEATETTKSHSMTAFDVRDMVKDTLGENSYLLYAITDIGRGESKKRIKIIPNYRLSKGLDYTSYTLSVIEGSYERESLSFNINPSLIVNGVNISLQSMVNTNSTQISCAEDVNGIEDFITAVSKISGIDTSTLYKYDLLFGKTNKGTDIEGVTVNTVEGLDLSNAAGQKLDKGSNGSFGARPFSIINKDAKDVTEADEYTKAIVAAFDGSFDRVIFNVDQHKIDLVVDANYPPVAKKSIEALADFREDFMYIRDQGIGQTSYDLIKEATEKESRSMFCASYPQSYDVIDPYTKKQISVTIGYDLAQKFVAHCNNGRILPPAGMKHEMTIDNAIYGTLSFSPTICPDDNGGNEKEMLDDLRVNYASYIDNKLVVETLYTSQERNSQWSYINNVMGIQEVVKAIRTKCPVIRYSFIDGEDLEKYKQDIEEVLSPYSSNYKQLSLEYVSDTTYSANKIFYAVLNVVYKEFEQTEWFKVTALSAVTTEQS